ncbi:hypothetical protein [Lacticaseibacillus absianus]|uniref:hypothetical protein n=1 Tax=Lacticaseibacillus absianus TaxID=2729623 RepID=UPI0015C813E7|nr:hypothetical protein [Lacticaseibacillus absianus]
MRHNKLMSVVTLACALAIPLSAVHTVLAVEAPAPVTTEGTDTPDAAPVADAAAETPVGEAAPVTPEETPEVAVPEGEAETIVVEAEDEVVAETPEAPTSPVVTLPAAVETPSVEADKPQTDHWAASVAATAHHGTIAQTGDQLKPNAVVRVNDTLVLRYKIVYEGKGQWRGVKADFAVPKNYQLANVNNRITLRIGGRTTTIENRQTNTLTKVAVGDLDAKKTKSITVDVPVVAKGTTANQAAATARFYGAAHERKATLALPKPKAHEYALQAAPNFTFGSTTVEAIATRQTTVYGRADSALTVLNTDKAKVARVTARLSSFDLGAGYRPGGVTLKFRAGGQWVSLQDNNTTTTVMADMNGHQRVTESQLVIDQFDLVSAGQKSATITWEMSNTR